MSNANLILKSKGIVIKNSEDYKDSLTAVVFPGHGSQYPGMFKSFKNKTFVRVMENANEIYEKQTGFSLLKAMNSQRINEPIVMQPAIFSVDYAMFKVLMDSKVDVDVLLGHSFGELAALCAAGAFSFSDGIRISLMRAKVLTSSNSKNSGFMLSVMVNDNGRVLKEYIKSMVSSSLNIAIVNDSKHFVVSGRKVDIVVLKKWLKVHRIESNILPIPFPFHSRLLDGPAQKFKRELESINFNRVFGTKKVYSTILSRFYKDSDFSSLPEIISSQFVTPFNFRKSVSDVSQFGVKVFIESGAGYITSNLVQKNLNEIGDSGLVINTNSKTENPNYTFKKAMTTLSINNQIGVKKVQLEDSEILHIERLTGYPEDLVMTMLADKSQKSTEMRFAVPETIASKIDELMATSHAKPIKEDIESTTAINVLDTVKQIIGNETGYPVDVLDGEADMEADLGIDSVKQADIFVRICEALKIDQESFDKPTEIHSINELVEVFNKKNSADKLTVEVNDRDVSKKVVSVASRDDITTFLKNKIQESTGYPVDVLEGDADLEADLGIDSVKQAEIVSEVMSYYGLKEDILNQEGNRSIDGIVNLINAKLKNNEAAEPEKDTVIEKRSTNALEVILQTVSDQTGYPKDVLEKDADLEADLGIDSVKKAEILATLSDKLSYSVDSDEEIGALNTISDINEYVKKKSEHVRPHLEKPANLTKRFHAEAISYPITMEKNLGVYQDNNILIVGAKNHDKFSDELINQLSVHNNIEIVPIEKLTSTLAISQNIADAILKIKEPIDCVVNIQLIESESIGKGYENIEEWNEAVNQTYDTLFYTSKFLYTTLAENHGKYIAISNVGNSFGAQSNVIKNPISGISSGFIKGLEKELRPFDSKIIDFDDLTNPQETVKAIISELEHTGKSIEISYVSGQRKRLITVPSNEMQISKKLAFSSNDTVLVTGGARGITLACVQKLLDETHCNCVLTGRTAFPDGTEKWLNMDEDELETFKEEFIRSEKKSHPEKNLVQINQSFLKIKHARQIYKNITNLRQRGFNVEYFVCDFSKDKDVKALRVQLDQEHTEVTGIINGAGLPSFGKVPHKNEDFARKVVDLKASSLFLLNQYFLENSRVKFVVSMGSISGRFGMDGQVDYSAGADVLVKMSKNLSIQYPNTNFKVIGWPAWKSVGMAATKDVMKVQEGVRGLTYISVEEGQRHFWQEINDNGKYVEYLYFGKLGKANMPLGQLDYMNDQMTELKSPLDEKGFVLQRSHFPLIDQITFHSDDVLMGEKTLDHKYDRHLDEHLVKQQSVLAGVYHVEAAAEMAQIFAELKNLDGLVVSKVSNFKFNQFIKYYETNPLKLKFSLKQVSLTDNCLVVHVKILSDFINKKGELLINNRLHSEGEITLTRHYKLGNVRPIKRVYGKQLDLDKYYREAKNNIYFGSDFRDLEAVQLDLKDSIKGSLTVHDEGKVFANNLGAETLISPIMIDNLGRLMLLNEYQQNGKSIIPVEISEAQIYDTIKSGDHLTAFSEKISEDSDSVTYKAVAFCDGREVFDVSSMKLHNLENVSGIHDIIRKNQ